MPNKVMTVPMFGSQRVNQSQSQRGYGDSPGGQSTGTAIAWRLTESPQPNSVKLSAIEIVVPNFFSIFK